MNDKKNDLTAIDVINQFLEFQSRVSSTALWKESEFTDNLPCLYRFKQLQALFQAFDLGEFTKFESGDFVKKRPPEDYQVIYAQVQDYFKALGESNQIYFLNHLKTRDDISNLFKRLFLYRKRIHDVLTFNSGVLAAIGLHYYVYRKTEDNNQIIREKLEPFDNLIGLIISPKNCSFTKKQLIEQFFYPDVDLSEIDLEWL